MADFASLFGLLASMLIPWLLGSVWVLAMLRTTGSWNFFIVAGQGYLVGIFLTTVFMRLWFFAELPWHFWSMAGALLALMALGIVAIQQQDTPTRQPSSSPPRQRWHVVVTALLLALIFLRYSTIAQELMLRPLFPWDAWMNWAPKAITWYHFSDTVSFVSPQDWLQAPGDALYYTEGAGKAWKNPITIPLLQLWGMLALGSSDTTLIYLPWLLVALALGLALYGHLRLAGASMPLATLATYALLNLPFINVHVALAGYADIWVTAAFGCAVFALHEWEKNRQWPYAVLALLLATLCALLKVPGLIMGGIILFILLTSKMKPAKIVSTALFLVIIAVVIYAFTIGIDMSIPLLGHVTISSKTIILPYIGQYDLQFHPVGNAMINTLFLMLNWNILWYLFLFLIAVSLVQGKTRNIPSLDLRAVLFSLFFIFFVYFFTNRYKFALDYTQVNRAFIYSVPPTIFYFFNRIRAVENCDGHA